MFKAKFTLLAAFALVFIAGCGDDPVEATTPQSTYNVTLSMPGFGPVTVETRIVPAEKPKAKGETQSVVVDNSATITVNDDETGKNIYLKFLNDDGNDAIATYVVGVSALTQVFPPINLLDEGNGNDCFLSRQDFSLINNFYQAKVSVTENREIVAFDCDKSTVPLLFELTSLTENNFVDCDIEGFGVYRQPFTDSNVHIIPDALVERWHICRPLLEGTISAIKDGKKVPGIGFSVNGVDMPNSAIVKASDSVPGFKFMPLRDGTIRLPAIDDTKRVVKETTTINLVVKSYGGPRDGVKAKCNFLKPLPTVSMNKINSQIFRESFDPVRTDTTYECEFFDPITGGPLDVSNTVVEANELQIVSVGAKYPIVVNEYGEIVVTMVDATLTCVAYDDYAFPAYVHVGNLGDFTSYPLQVADKTWSVTVSLPIGIYEANVSFGGGAHKALYRTDNGIGTLNPVAVGHDCEFSVNGRDVITYHPYAHAVYWIFDLRLNDVENHAGSGEVTFDIGASLAPR